MRSPAENQKVAKKLNLVAKKPETDKTEKAQKATWQQREP